MANPTLDFNEQRRIFTDEAAMLRDVQKQRNTIFDQIKNAAKSVDEKNLSSFNAVSDNIKSSLSNRIKSASAEELFQMDTDAELLGFDEGTSREDIFAGTGGGRVGSGGYEQGVATLRGIRDKRVTEQIAQEKQQDDFTSVMETRDNKELTGEFLNLLRGGKDAEGKNMLLDFKDDNGKNPFVDASGNISITDENKRKLAETFVAGNAGKANSKSEIAVLKGLDDIITETQKRTIDEKLADTKLEESYEQGVLNAQSAVDDQILQNEKLGSNLGVDWRKIGNRATNRTIQDRAIDTMAAISPPQKTTVGKGADGVAKELPVEFNYDVQFSGDVKPSSDDVQLEILNGMEEDIYSGVLENNGSPINQHFKAELRAPLITEVRELNKKLSTIPDENRTKSQEQTVASSKVRLKKITDEIAWINANAIIGTHEDVIKDLGITKMMEAGQWFFVGETLKAGNLTANFNKHAGANNFNNPVYNRIAKRGKQAIEAERALLEENRLADNLKQAQRDLSASKALNLVRNEAGTIGASSTAK